MNANWMESLEDHWVRLNCNGNARVEFYQTMATLLENRVLLRVALQELAAAYSDDGRKPKASMAIVCDDCAREIAGGRSLSDALSRWTNRQEVALIAAGEKSGDLASAFRDAIKMIRAKQEIYAAVAGAFIYPLFLLAFAAVVLNLISTRLVPKFVQVSDPQTWEGAAKLLYGLAQFTTTYGLLTAAGVVAFVVAIFASMPYLRGGVRVALDQMPPWSIYRMLHGSTFLLNISVMLRAGIKLQDALEMLAAHASPWLHERLKAALYGTGMGDNLGAALHNAGYSFPDKRAVRFLRVLASRDGFEETLSSFGEAWLRESIERIRKASKVLFGLGIVIVTALLVLLVTGIAGMNEAVQNAMQ